MHMIGQAQVEAADGIPSIGILPFEVSYKSRCWTCSRSFFPPCFSPFTNSSRIMDWFYHTSSPTATANLHSNL